jgi:1-acyl-sn-glycerol-3-phosphate acyltransferase
VGERAASRQSATCAGAAVPAPSAARDAVAARTPSLAARVSQATRGGIAFAYYGLASLALAYAVIPLHHAAARLAGRAGDPDLAAQRLIHLASRSFVRLMLLLGLARVRYEGLERLRGPALVAANHPSLIDTPLLHCCLPQADFVVNPAWGEKALLRRVVAAAGYLRTDAGGVAVVREAAARLRAGRSVVIFPEGSRTPPEGMLPFQRGAAHIALAAGCDLVPVVIQVIPRTLVKGQPWAQVPARRPEWRIEVGQPIHPADHLDGSESRPLAARRLTALLQDYFEKRWERGIA